MAYPELDFSGLLEGDEDENAEKMAECIQALIDLLSEEILQQPIEHINGLEIVSGNAEHCINLLQILQQICQGSMVQDDSASPKESQGNAKSPGQSEQRGKKSAKKSQGSPAAPSG